MFVNVFSGDERPQNLLPYQGFCVSNTILSEAIKFIRRGRWPMSKNTGVVEDLRYIRHGAGLTHPETPDLRIVVAGNEAR